MNTENQRCVRCNAYFNQRKPKSVQYTLAWTVAALVMFFPANIYPMMVFYTLGAGEASTILEWYIFIFTNGHISCRVNYIYC
jgi:paraquat-inducible protein A